MFVPFIYLVEFMNNSIGFFWIGEFISTAIGIEHCSADGCSAAICYTQLVLDIPNLLAVKFFFSFPTFVFVLFII